MSETNLFEPVNAIIGRFFEEVPAYPLPPAAQSASQAASPAAGGSNYASGDTKPLMMGDIEVIPIEAPPPTGERNETLGDALDRVTHGDPLVDLVPDLKIVSVKNTFSASIKSQELELVVPIAQLGPFEVSAGFDKHGRLLGYEASLGWGVKVGNVGYNAAELSIGLTNPDIALEMSLNARVLMLKGSVSARPGPGVDHVLGALENAIKEMYAVPRSGAF